MRRSLLLAALAAALLTGTAQAQQVPTMGDDGWVLPVNDQGAVAAPAVQGGYGSGVEQWRDEVDAACAVHGCSTDYILSVMACESGGDPNAVGPNGELGIMQVDPRYWGVMSSIEQIWFAAEHLTNGTVWWACG